MSPLVMFLVLAVGPISLIISLFLCAKLLLWLFRKLVPLLLFVFDRKKSEKKFIQLTFPSDTSKSAYATEQLYSLLHHLAKQKSTFDQLLQKKTIYSLEIVSRKDEGIRYILATDEKSIDVIKRSLLSYLPGIKMDEVEDYLESTLSEPQNLIISELKLSSHFALPLKSQKTLSEHDLISYLTGNMTKLNPNELISFQAVLTPVLNHTHQNIVREMNELKRRMYKGLPLTSSLDNGDLKKILSLPGISLVAGILKVFLKILNLAILFVISIPWAIADSTGKSVPILYTPPPVSQEILNPYETDLSTVVKEKIGQPLFEASIRLLVVSKGKNDADTRLENRVAGFLAALGPLGSPYQSIGEKGIFLGMLFGSLALKKTVLIRWKIK